MFLGKRMCFTLQKYSWFLYAPCKKHCDCPVENIEIWEQQTNKFSYLSKALHSTSIGKNNSAYFSSKNNNNNKNTNELIGKV